MIAVKSLELFTYALFHTIFGSVWKPRFPFSPVFLSFEDKTQSDRVADHTKTARSSRPAPAAPKTFHDFLHDKEKLCGERAERPFSLCETNIAEERDNNTNIYPSLERALHLHKEQERTNRCSTWTQGVRLLVLIAGGSPAHTYPPNKTNTTNLHHHHAPPASLRRTRRPRRDSRRRRSSSFRQG